MEASRKSSTVEIPVTPSQQWVAPTLGFGNGWQYPGTPVRDIGGAGKSVLVKGDSLEWFGLWRFGGRGELSLCAACPCIAAAGTVLTEEAELGTEAAVPEFITAARAAAATAAAVATVAALPTAVPLALPAAASTPTPVAAASAAAAAGAFVLTCGMLPPAWSALLQRFCSVPQEIQPRKTPPHTL